MAIRETMVLSGNAVEGIETESHRNVREFFSHQEVAVLT